MTGVMAIGRRPHWTRRRLKELLEPGEEVTLVERLPVSGSWATTDRALYVIEHSGVVRRYILGQLSSVHVEPEQRIATIRTTRGEVVIVATKRRSAILKRLSHLAS